MIVNEEERLELVDVIYEYLMSIPCLDMDDMGDARYEAERIVHVWEIRTNSIKFNNQKQ